jgi:hypothetical protein
MGPRLDEDVAQRGRLDGPCRDRHTSKIRGELAQQCVARSATDNMDDLGLPSGQIVGRRDGLGVRGGE